MVPAVSAGEVIVAACNPVAAGTIDNLVTTQTVVTVAAVELIVPADDRVVSIGRASGCDVVARDEVTVGAAEQGVGASLQRVVSRAVAQHVAEQGIRATTAVHHVVPAREAIRVRRRRAGIEDVAHQDVNAVLAVDDVVAGVFEACDEVADEDVVAVAAPYRVVAAAAADGVVAAETKDDVVTAQRLDRVRTWRADDEVVSFRPENGRHRDDTIHSCGGLRVCWMSGRGVDRDCRDDGRIQKRVREATARLR